MPPTARLVPAGATVPVTVRLTMPAPSWTYRNNPWWEPSWVQDRPLMVCPPPSKVPPKVGTLSRPERSKSFSRRTVLPWDQASRRQLWTNAVQSSGVRRKTVSLSAPAQGSRGGHNSTALSRTAHRERSSFFMAPPLPPPAPAGSRRPFCPAASPGRCRKCPRPPRR